MSTSTSWRVPAIAWLPISAAIIAETVSNGLRAYGLGTHLEKFTVTVMGFPISLAGAVLVLAAVAVSLSQARAAWLALMPGPWRQRIVAGLAGTILLAVSVTAMATHILEAERTKVGAEAGQSTDYTNAKNEFDGLAGQIAALKRFGANKDALPRPREAVQTQIDAANINWKIWRKSAKCTDITLEESKDECGKVLPLYEEQGAYASLVLLEPKLKASQAKLEALPKPAKAATTVEETVVGWWAWLMGVAVVFIATFGSVIWAKPTSSPMAAVKAQDGAVGSDLPLHVTDAATHATQLAGVSDTELQRLRRYFETKAEEASEPDPTKPKKKSKRQSRKDHVIAKIRAHTLKHGAPPAFRVVQSRHRLPKATAHRYLKAALN